MALLRSFLLVTSLACAKGSAQCNGMTLSQGIFPKGFIFGAATSAYQIEGGVEYKGQSIWDNFTHKYPAAGSNGDIALDSYHRYKEDVDVLKMLGMDAYRFSIAWTRILPHGNLRGGVSKEGINYYNSLIDEIISNCMKPVVTIFHFDSPQDLEDEYDGFLNKKIVDDFYDFANICFNEFGDRVKHWITLNEPNIFSDMGYALGLCAPGRCSKFEAGNCTVGDSATELYLVVHHLLLAHAATVKLYRKRYQGCQKGIIGMVIDVTWMLPYSNSPADIDAAQRSLDFTYGWLMDPISFGEYPASMRAMVRHRLRKFTKEESDLLRGSYDFIGLNYYTTNYPADIPESVKVNISYTTDSRANLTGTRNGFLIGPQAASSWLYIYPRGIYDLLTYTKEKYNNPVIYITENGVDELRNDSLPLFEDLNDNMRIESYCQHIKYVHQAIGEGVDVRGYFAWALVDDFEWNTGYTVRFGLAFVDYNNDLKRIPKESAYWFSQLLEKDGHKQIVNAPRVGCGGEVAQDKLLMHALE
ncbi:beta-glucosidase 12-like isoform X2 [Tasmannia lanceolata]|uniref:beta-glucosidase 12-like isoform X2 n=1 Tax=Tasmannia lanceolata TaxID=3420 RepID=UPI004064194D